MILFDFRSFSCVLSGSWSSCENFSAGFVNGNLPPKLYCRLPINRIIEKWCAHASTIISVYEYSGMCCSAQLALTSTILHDRNFSPQPLRGPKILGFFFLKKVLGIDTPYTPIVHSVLMLSKLVKYGSKSKNGEESLSHQTGHSDVHMPKKVFRGHMK